MEINLPESTRAELTKLGVAALYLFGSHSQGVAGPLSDYDFGVLMDRSGHRRSDTTYNALYDLLAPFCPRTLQNDVLDIVFLNDAPLELRMHVVRYGRILFTANHNRAAFEEHTMEEYCDYRPILDMMDKATLERI